jgi:hypothetical protein
VRPHILAIHATRDRVLAGRDAGLDAFDKLSGTHLQQIAGGLRSRRTFQLTAASVTATIKASRTSGDISSRRRFALEASTCTSNVPKSRALGDDVDCASDATLVGIELHNVEFLVLAYGAEHNHFVVLGHRQREALLA